MPALGLRLRTMITTIEGLPEGTIGFTASGTITRDDYRERLIPAIRAALERGHVNLVFETAPDFRGIDSGGLWEDAKAAGSFGLKHLGSWGRIAVVTDRDWMRHAVSGFGWMSPGEYRVFEPAEREAAVHWATGAA
jgi:hypothetical protein